MFQGIKVLKRYYKLANLKKSFLVFQFFLLLTPALLSIVSPILTANIISSLTVFDFSKAIYILTLDFIIIVATAIFYFVYHLVSRKINKILYLNFNQYLYENIRQNKDIKEINLPTLTNVAVCIEFNKNFLFKLCFFIKSIITLAIIFYINWYFCLIIIAVSFISYFLLRITDKKIQEKTKLLSNLQCESLELFNSIHKGGEIEENYNLDVVLKNKYFDKVNSQIKVSNNLSLMFSINKNFISMILKATIFIMTIFLIGQIKSTMLTLSLYLILTPYLTSSAQNLISFFDLFSEFGNVENILNEFESLKFSKPNITSEVSKIDDFNLYLHNLSCHGLKDINLDLPFGKNALIKCSEKEYIFSLVALIKRQETPPAGSIYLGEKNISNIKIETYRKIVSVVSEKSIFFNVSLIENLKLVCPSKNIINKAIKDFNLRTTINNLPEKENCLLDDSLLAEFLFLIDLLRSYVSGAKIICIENLPTFFSDEYKEIFFHIIKFLNGKRSLLIFNYKNNLNLKTHKKYILEKETLKAIK